MAILKSLMLIVLIIISTLNQHLVFQKSNRIDQNIGGIILPHHLLVGSLLDKFYQEVKKQNEYDTIFLISPNHFGYGYHYTQTTTQKDKKNFNLNLDEKIIKKLAEEKVAFIENTYYPQEHGITAEISYINKYFPKSKVIPIIIKNKSPQKELDRLAEEIKKLKTDHTLIIASIDFSHYCDENFALKNDARTIKWLRGISKSTQKTSQESYEETQNLAKSFDTSNPDSVGIDSPESLYVFTSIMKSSEKSHFSLWDRTSTASLTGLPNASQNTSHIFGTFH